MISLIAALTRISQQPTEDFFDDDGIQLDQLRQRSDHLRLPECNDARVQSELTFANCSHVSNCRKFFNCKFS